jgi:Zn finger protein HypA/HybF involved in hydrogenase expression
MKTTTENAVFVATHFDVCCPKCGRRVYTINSDCYDIQELSPEDSTYYGYKFFMEDPGDDYVIIEEGVAKLRCWECDREISFPHEIVKTLMQDAKDTVATRYAPYAEKENPS